jgi:hypothetical protein
LCQDQSGSRRRRGALSKKEFEERLIPARSAEIAR